MAQTFSVSHIQKMNRLFCWVLLAHVPFVALVAYLFDSSVWQGLGFAAVILAGPIRLTLMKGNPQLAAISHGIAAMAFSGLLIHLGKGMIELHFHVFVFLAVTAVFGYFWVPLAAAGTIAVHHLGFFYFLPESVFNYEASLWIVLTHAFFVVIETAPVTYISLLFGRFIRAQELLTQQFSESFGRLEGSAQTLSGVSENQIHVINDHAASVEETAAAMTEIKSMIEATSARVRECSELSRAVVDRTSEGTHIVGQLSLSMETIQQSNDQLQSIVRIVNEIGEKTAVINAIVEKTELLSFNASIEAARAGQHGRGFAVVAEEVGKLANLSGNAAREISALLKESQRNVADIITVVQGRVSEGKSVTNDVISKFNEIESNVVQIQNRVTAISEAAREQEKGIEQTAVAMQRLNGHSQKSHEAARNVNATAAHIHQEAQTLKAVYTETTALVDWRALGSARTSGATEVTPQRGSGPLAPPSSPVGPGPVGSNQDIAQRIREKYAKVS